MQIDLNSREVHALLTGPGLYPELWSKDGKEILLTRGQAEASFTRIWTIHADRPSIGRALTPRRKLQCRKSTTVARWSMAVLHLQRDRDVGNIHSGFQRATRAPPHLAERRRSDALE